MHQKKMHQKKTLNFYFISLKKYFPTEIERWFDSILNIPSKTDDSAKPYELILELTGRLCCHGYKNTSALPSISTRWCQPLEDKFFWPLTNIADPPEAASCCLVAVDVKQIDVNTVAPPSVFKNCCTQIFWRTKCGSSHRLQHLQWFGGGASTQATKQPGKTSWCRLWTHHSYIWNLRTSYDVCSRPPIIIFESICALFRKKIPQQRSKSCGERPSFIQKLDLRFNQKQFLAFLHQCRLSFSWFWFQLFFLANPF